jgi:hypothetical protein
MVTVPAVAMKLNYMDRHRPNRSDTDSDDFSDTIEIAAGSDDQSASVPPITAGLVGCGSET